MLPHQKLQEGLVDTLLSTFHVAVGPSFNILCSHRTFHQLFVRPRDLLFTFHAAAGPSINFLCIHRTFNRLSVHLSDRPSTFRVAFREFSCMYRTIRQFHVRRENFPPSIAFILAFLSTSSVRRDLPATFGMVAATSINFQCGDGTFCQLPVRSRYSSAVTALFVTLRGGRSTSGALTGLYDTFH